MREREVIIPKPVESEETREDTEIDLLKLYMQEAEKYPQPTSEEVMYLLQTLENGAMNVYPLQNLVQNHSAFPEEKKTLDRLLARAKHLRNGNLPPPPAEVSYSDNLAELGRTIQGAELAKTYLINSNFRLVVWVAEKYQGKGIPLLDLIQEGNLGLIMAVEKFDCRQECKFSPFAVYQIRNFIERAFLGQKDSRFSLPADSGWEVGKVAKAYWRFMGENGRPPTAQELSQETRFSPQKVRKILSYHTSQILSLDSLPLPHQLAWEEVFPASEDTEEETLASIFQQENRKIVEAILSKLEPQQREILERYFGFGRQRQPLQKIGKDFGITWQAAQQRLKTVLKKVAQQIQNDPRLLTAASSEFSL